jgi:uncharacterized protein YjbJ (UPF0337 family)
MLNEHRLQRQWSEIQGRLRERWTEVTADDLALFSGTIDELVDLVQRRTGEARDVVRQHLSAIAGDMTLLGRHTAATFAECGRQARQTIDEAAAPMLESLERARRQGTVYVRRHPSEAMGLCLGAGMLAGLLVGWMTRRRS